MVELDYNEREILLACIEFIQNGNIGFEAIEGYLDISVNKIYEILPNLKEKL